MGYQIEELLRSVGTEGVSEEEVTQLIKEVVGLQIKVNKILNIYRQAQMKNMPGMGLQGASQDEAKTAY